MKTKAFLASSLLFAASVSTAFADNWMGNSNINVNKDWNVSSGWTNQTHIGSVSFLSISAETEVWYDGDINLENVSSAKLFYKFDGDDNTIQSLPLTWYAYHVPNTIHNGFKLATPQDIDISGLTEGDHLIDFWFQCTYDNMEVYDSYYFDNNTNKFANYVVKFFKVSALSDTENNSSMLSNHNTWDVDIQIVGRTLKAGQWNTLCLPFTLPLQGSILENATVKYLQSSSIVDGTLTMNFGSFSQGNINAGTPYLVRLDDNATDITNPKFYNVKITTSSTNPTQQGDVVFNGCFDPVQVTGDNILYLGANNQLYFPGTNLVSIGAFRGYFELPAAKQVKAIVLNFGDDTNSIQTISNESSSNDGYFTLDGRRLNDKPATAGLYIINGKKVVIK